MGKDSFPKALCPARVDCSQFCTVSSFLLTWGFSKIDRQLILMKPAPPTSPFLCSRLFFSWICSLVWKLCQQWLGSGLEPCWAKTTVSFNLGASEKHLAKALNGPRGSNTLLLPIQGGHLLFCSVPLSAASCTPTPCAFAMAVALVKAFCD